MDLSGLVVLFGALMMVPAGVFAGSAVSGYEDTADCDDALDDVARRLSTSLTVTPDP